MKKISVLVFFLVSFVSAGALIDRNAFEVPIGSVYQYSGTFSGVRGDLVITFLDGSLVADGAIRADAVFTSISGDGDFSMSTYAVDGAIIERRVNNQFGRFTLNFSPAWRPGPRFVEIGKAYNSSASYSYTASGVSVSADIAATGGIERIETVNTPLGDFEAMKMVFDVVTTESYPGGWVQTVETDTAWIVRGVGMVRLVVEGRSEDSQGGVQTVRTDHGLVQANRPLTPMSVLPSANWYQGWNYMVFPWSYSSATAEWYYYGGAPALHRYSDGQYTQFDQEEMGDWCFIEYPFVYSLKTETWYAIYGTVQVYDWSWGDWTLLE